MALKFNYGKSRNTADKLINKFGALAELQRHPSFTPEACMVAAVSYDTRQIDGTRIRQSDRYLIISATKPSGGLLDPPRPERDRIKLVDGKVFEVISCNPLSPAGVVVMYEAQGRA